MRSRAGNCFYERDPDLALVRRATTEGVGTLLLMLVATSSGLQARHHFPSEPGLGLLFSALTIAGALVGIIVAFGAVSGGHFNPLITALQWLGRERNSRCTCAYIGAQATGAILGAMIANAIFGGSLTDVPATEPTWRRALSEFAASAGLMAVVVLGCARSERPGTGPFAVGGWLAGAIIATPSTSYANPEIALSAVLATGPLALDWMTAVAYVFAQCAGAVVGFVIVGYAYPRIRQQAGDGVHYNQVRHGGL